MPIQKVESSKLCQHGKWIDRLNLRRTWFIIEERKDTYNSCCNEKMDVVYSTTRKAAEGIEMNKLAFCQCCGKLINPYGIDLQNLDDV